jgi:F0F1-type ATP synthase assembly protein I
MGVGQQQSPESRGFGSGYAIVGAGFQFAFAILLFLGGGHLVDRWLDTRPVFTLIGLAIGLGAGFYAFLRRVLAESGPPSRPRGSPGTGERGGTA